MESGDQGPRSLLLDPFSGRHIGASVPAAPAAVQGNFFFLLKILSKLEHIIDALLLTFFDFIPR